MKVKTKVSQTLLKNKEGAFLKRYSIFLDSLFAFFFQMIVIFVKKKKKMKKLFVGLKWSQTRLIKLKIATAHKLRMPKLHYTTTKSNKIKEQSNKRKKYNKMAVKGEKMGEDEKVLQEYIKTREHEKMWKSLKELISSEKYPNTECITNCLKSLPKNFKKKEVEEFCEKLKTFYLSQEDKSALKSLLLAMLSIHMRNRNIISAKSLLVEIEKHHIRIDGLAFFHLVELEYIESGIGSG